MKVFFISHSSGTEGAEKALLETVSILKEQGVECSVLLPTDGKLTTQLAQVGASVSKLPYRWWMGEKKSLWQRTRSTIKNMLVTAFVISKLYRSKPDVIWTNTIVIPVGAFAAYILRRPHVWNIHEFGLEDHGLHFDWGETTSCRLLGFLSSICIANSNAVASKFHRFIDPSKIKVIYYSMHTAPHVSFPRQPEDRIPVPKRAFRAAIVGRISKSKGQGDSLLALGELAKRGVPVELLIVGRTAEPKYESYLRELIAQNNLQSQITFIGQVENPLPFFQSADVALVCSRNEAFGRVTIEAMLAGRPVIGTRSGGTTELIREGFNGYLYDPGNFKQLAERIKYLYENPATCRELGENARRWAESTFNKERYTSELVSVLNTLSPNGIKQVIKGNSD